MNDRNLILSATDAAGAATTLISAALLSPGAHRTLKVAEAVETLATTSTRLRKMIGQSPIEPQIPSVPPVICDFLLEQLRWRVTAARSPDFIVGTLADPYLRRWYVTPRNEDAGNIYLHNFVRSDDDRALHDHPWDNVTLVLAGTYLEHLEDGTAVERKPGSVVIRKAAQAHRVELPEERTGDVWSLFLTGPKVREWGFLCPQGWVHYRDFTKPGAKGEIGKGCGE